MPEHQTFGQYQLAQTKDASPLELYRTDDEVTCLAFDMDRQCFVEIHVFAEDELDAEPAKGKGDRGRAKGAGVVEVAERLVAVRHPSVTRVFETGYDEGTPYLVTEFVDGESVTRYLERTRPLPEPLALRLALDLAEGCVALGGSPLVLAGLDLFRARVVSEPGMRRHVRARVYNFGLGPGLRGRKEDPKIAETRCCLEVGRVLARAVDAPASIEKRRLREVLSRIELSPESKALLFDVLRGKCTRLDDLVVWLGSRLDELEDEDEADEDGIGGGGLWTASAEYEPIRVMREFVRKPEEAVILAGSVGTAPAGASGPYACAGIEPDLDRPCVFQLLPAPDLCGVSLVNGVRRAMDEVDPARFPHLVSVLAVWEDDEKGDFFAEEPGTGETILDHARQRDGLEANGIVDLLREVHAACAEAAEAGFALWELSPQIECFPRQNEAPGAGGVSVKLRVYPTLRHLAQPGIFSPNGLTRESATVSPDDFDAFVDFGIQLARLEANPLVRGTLARFLESERTRKDRRTKGLSPQERRQELIDRLATHIAELRIDTMEGEALVAPAASSGVSTGWLGGDTETEGMDGEAQDEDDEDVATTAIAHDHGGSGRTPRATGRGPATLLGLESNHDDRADAAEYDEADEREEGDQDDDDPDGPAPEVGAAPEAGPGLAQVLFGDSETSPEDWNPVARAIVGDPGEDAGDGSAAEDLLGAERGPTLADRLFFWAVVIVVLVLLAVVYFVAQMQGWLPEFLTPPPAPGTDTAP